MTKTFFYKWDRVNSLWVMEMTDEEYRVMHSREPRFFLDLFEYIKAKRSTGWGDSNVDCSIRFERKDGGLWKISILGDFFRFRWGGLYQTYKAIQAIRGESGFVPFSSSNDDHAWIEIKGLQ